MPSATSAMRKPSMVPPRTVPHVTSDQRSFTPTIIPTSGSAAESVARARSEVVTSLNVRILDTTAQDRRTVEIRGHSCRPGCSVSPMPHPDVARERARLRFAQECLENMRRRTAKRVADEDVLAANEADAEAVKWQLQRRLVSLNDDFGSLCFGRIDDENRDRWYIGRRHVEEATGTPVVVDWRASIATPFYRATLADP